MRAPERAARPAETVIEALIMSFIYGLPGNSLQVSDHPCHGVDRATELLIALGKLLQGEAAFPIEVVLHLDEAFDHGPHAMPG